LSHVVLRHRARSNFSVDAHSVWREFEELLHLRRQRRARFAAIEFKVEVLLLRRLVSQAGATLAKAQDTVGKFLPPGRRLLHLARGCCGCRLFATVGEESKVQVI
jgi:hypothetical protein